MAKPIKDLKALKVLRGARAIDIKVLKDLSEQEAFFLGSPLSVVCDRLITNGSRSGDPDLQG